MLDDSMFKEDMEVNFFGLVKTLGSLPNRVCKGSNIIFFSTAVVSTGIPFHTSIAAANGAVEAFAKALVAELAPRVHVNVIAPSLVETPHVSRLLNSEVKKEQMAGWHPLQRVGSAADIAGLAVYHLIFRDVWITGHVVRADGGTSKINLV